MRVHLYNLVGNQVREILDISSDQVFIERSGLPSGIYFYSVQRANEVVGMGKVVIQ